MTSKKTLDKSKPHATVHGDPTSDVAFEQEGEHYNALGEHIGRADGQKPQAVEPEPKEGHGNLAHGQIPAFNKPIEEHGGGGGMTKSYPQTTDDGKKVIDEHDEHSKPKKK
jgi:hypothetical protein